MAVQIDGSQGNVIATKGTYSGSVSIGGTLTYEDVTNIDSVGIITARTSIEVGARPGVGASISSDGNAIFSGITTITQLGGSPKLTSGQTITGTANDGNISIQGGLTYPGGLIRLGGGSGDDDIRFSVSGGSGTPSEKARISSGGNFGIGSNNPQVLLHIASTSPTLRIHDTTNNFYSHISADDSGSLILDGDAGNGAGSSRIVFKTDGSEHARIDSSGRLLVGATAKRNVLNQNGNSAGDSTTPLLYAEGVSDSKSLTIVSSNTNAHRGSILGLARTRATSVGGNTIVADDDNVGQIVFAANDGVDLLNNVATIRADIDASPGANDTPGRLVFSTTADGANVATERLRITSGGKFGIGLSAPTAKVAIVGGTASIPRLAFESGTDDNDFTFSQYEDGNGVYTMIGQNVKLDSSGNNDILDTGHRTAGITFDGRNNGALMFNTGDTNAFDERMRIDKAGLVSLGPAAYSGGGTSPALYVSTSSDRAVKFHNTTDSTISLQLTNSGSGQGDDNGLMLALLSNDDAWICNAENAHMRFCTNNTERARITSGGQLNVGTTVDALGVDTGNNTGVNITGLGRIYLKSNDHSECNIIGGGEAIRFRYGYTNGTTQADAGSIDITGTNSTAYNTSSDYRLKENQVAISDAITRLKLLKPYRFNFKSEPSKTVDGFFAHEVTPAVPEAVTGEKDDENRMQAMDYGRITPLLTAALQEAIAKIETLESEIAALKSS